MLFRVGEADVHGAIHEEADCPGDRRAEEKQRAEERKLTSGEDRRQQQAEADDAGQRRKAPKYPGRHVFAIGRRRRWRIDDDDVIVEAAHPDDGFLFFAELHKAFDELRLAAAEAGGLLAMVDGDAHELPPGVFGHFTATEP